MNDEWGDVTIPEKVEYEIEDDGPTAPPPVPPTSRA